MHSVADAIRNAERSHVVVAMPSVPRTRTTTSPEAPKSGRFAVRISTFGAPEEKRLPAAPGNIPVWPAGATAAPSGDATAAPNASDAESGRDGPDVMENCET